MATRTAPTVDGTITQCLTSISVVDASGDVNSVTIKTATKPTDAEIEAWVDAYQAATQASVFKVTIQSVYEGVQDSDNADTNQRNSVKDGINMLYKDVVNLRSQSPRLFAPVPAVMQGNQDIPLITGTPLETLLTAQATLYAGYDLQSVQYTERRERRNNARIKV